MHDIFDLPIIIVLAVAVLGAIAGLINNTLGNRYVNFVSERARAGVSSAEIGRELRLRMAAAALRRTTSEAVLRRPADYAEIVRSHAKAEGLSLAVLDKPMARQFLQWAEGAELSEILYPAAMKAVWKEIKRAQKLAPRAKLDPITRSDLDAALRVRD